MHTCIHAYMQTYRHTDIQTYRHTGIQTSRHTDIQTYRHIDAHTYIHTHIHIHIHIHILRMGCTPYCTVLSHVNNSYISSHRGPNTMPLWLKTTAASQRKTEQCRSFDSGGHRKRKVHSGTTRTTYWQERPFHRLSAVGLHRSLRAGSRGPYIRWLKKTTAITHSLLRDMPSHQLPARSQILHRVSILVEVKPQNWDQAYPDDLWLPRGKTLPTIPAIEGRDSTPGKRRSSARQSSPPMTPRTKAKPTSSNPPSPIQDATPSGVGSFQQVNAPSSGSDIFTAYQSELTEYKTSLDKATEEESVLQARLTEMAAYANQQFIFLENTTHQEMTSMAQQLQILNSELLAAQQEDEGATYRIEELERYRTMSNEAASHLEFRYSQLRSEFNEQIGQANAIMVQVGTDANAHINQLRLELENAEMNAKQEALAVGFANDQTCALRIEMLEVANQNQTMKHTMSLSIRRLETELDAADAKREEIMREFRSNIRSEHDRYAECEHHLALEESQLQLQLFRNEGLHSQLMTSESRLSEELSSETSGMRDMRIMGLRSELHMKQSLLDRMQQQLTESKNQYHELSCQHARKSSPSGSPSHGLYYEMYDQARRDHDIIKKSKEEVDILYKRARAEIIDNENLIKTYHDSYESLGKKYQDALERIDRMSTHPNASSNIFDNLHNEISDRDAMVTRLNTEIEAQRESLDRARRDAGRSISMLNDRRLVIKGATDYSIPESHLTEMHLLASERHAEVEEMSNTIAALKGKGLASERVFRHRFGTRSHASLSNAPPHHHHHHHHRRRHHHHHHLHSSPSSSAFASCFFFRLFLFFFFFFLAILFLISVILLIILIVNSTIIISSIIKFLLFFFSIFILLLRCQHHHHHRHRHHHHHHRHPPHHHHQQDINPKGVVALLTSSATRYKP